MERTPLQQKTEGGAQDFCRGFLFWLSVFAGQPEEKLIMKTKIATLDISPICCYYGNGKTIPKRRV